MLIIGCDYHPSVQQIAYVDTETGEHGEQRLMHRDAEAERFYRELRQREIKVRVGMEATGYARWFERLLAELGFELWIGDPARIRARRARKQKTDRQATAAAIVPGRGRVSTDMGAEPGESGSAPTPVASPSPGTNANADHEPTAS